MEWDEEVGVSIKKERVEVWDYGQKFIMAEVVTVLKEASIVLQSRITFEKKSVIKRKLNIIKS